MSLISVIVPVYNLQDYLARCLDSIINQTYKELEIIVVDDGSTDNSPTICDEYATKDSRIKVIHKQNGGVSSARNVGIDASTGDFIGFIDGDDIIEPDMYETLINNARLHNVDISCCQMDTVNVDGTTSKTYDIESQLLSKEYLIENYFLNDFVKDIMYSQCNKIFKKQVLRDIKYKSYALGEDILFVFEVLASCNGVYYDSKIGYHYIHRENSAMTSAFSQKRLDYIFATQEIVSICEKDYSFALDNAQQWFYRNVIVTLRAIIASENKAKYSKFYAEYKKYLKDFKNKLLPKQSTMRKLDYYLIMYFNPGLKLIVNLRR